MDKNIIRDLINLCWRLKVHQSDLTLDFLKTIENNYITEEGVKEFYEMRLKKFDDIIQSIDKVLVMGFGLGFKEFIDVSVKYSSNTHYSTKRLYFLNDLKDFLTRSKKVYKKQIK